MNNEAEKITPIQSATRLKDAGKKLHNTEQYVTDPRQAIIDFVAPFLDKIHIGPAKLLVATYRQQEKTAGGVIKTQRYVDEDKFQGVAGLVLKVGPLSFIDDVKVKFGGFKADQFQWVIYNPDYGRARELRGLHCRIIEDTYIDSVVDDPELFW